MHQMDCYKTCTYTLAGFHALTFSLKVYLGQIIMPYIPCYGAKIGVIKLNRPIVFRSFERPIFKNSTSMYITRTVTQMSGFSFTFVNLQKTHVTLAKVTCYPNVHYDQRALDRISNADLIKNIILSKYEKV